MASARLVSRMTIDTKSSDGVRAFKRGLDILQEVNRSGGIRAGEIAWRLDLPRPTVYRLLERSKNSATSRAVRQTIGFG